MRVFDDENLAAIVRITGGNFRLLHRLLTQIARVAKSNKLDRVTTLVVDAARESLVIGMGEPVPGWPTGFDRLLFAEINSMAAGRFSGLRG